MPKCILPSTTASSITRIRITSHRLSTIDIVFIKSPTRVGISTERKQIKHVYNLRSRMFINRDVVVSLYHQKTTRRYSRPISLKEMERRLTQRYCDQGNNYETLRQLYNHQAAKYYEYIQQYSVYSNRDRIHWS